MTELKDVRLQVTDLFARAHHWNLSNNHGKMEGFWKRLKYGAYFILDYDLTREFKL